MIDWFLEDTGDRFIIFGSNHLIMLTIYLILFSLLLYFRKEIRNNQRFSSILRWTFFTLLVGIEVIYQIWGAIQGTWGSHLPFHLCGVAGIIGAFALWTMHKRLIAIAFFICLVPALLALITPDLLYDFPSFRFIKFFTHHIIISLTGLFLAIISGPHDITWKSMLETYLYLVIYAFIAGFIINPWLDANYLYVSHLPEQGTALDLFGTSWWYRINLGIVALLVFIVQYSIFRISKRKLQNN